MNSSAKLVNTALASLAALFYSSWILGYILNPTVAKHGLASELGGVGEPWGKVFVGSDVITGLLLLALVYSLWRQLTVSKQVRIILFNIAIFGLATIIDALLPLGCSLSTQRCPTYTEDPMLLAHALFTVIATISLMLSLAFLWQVSGRNKRLFWLTISYMTFSYLTLLSVLFGNVGNWTQHLCLLTTSIVLVSLPWALSQASKVNRKN